MKFKNLLILVVFNIYSVIALNFSISFIGIVLSYIFDFRNIILDYYLWFSIGLFVGSLLINQFQKFLSLQFKEGNEYYLSLLRRSENGKKHFFAGSSECYGDEG